MSPEEASVIRALLRKRIVPRDVEEGEAIAMLGNKLVAHFTPVPPVPVVQPPAPPPIEG